MYDGNDIDFLYNLQPHGWSTCLLYINGNIYNFIITHAFSCPIADMIEAIMLINKGALESEFIFPGEPGGYRWWLKRNDKQHHKVIITISEISDFFTIAENEEEEVLVTFEIKKKQLYTLILNSNSQFCQSSTKSLKLASSDCKLLLSKSISKSLDNSSLLKQYCLIPALLTLIDF